MKLVILLVLLPIVYSTRLAYDSTGQSGITSYSFTWTNVGGTDDTGTGPDANMITTIEDGDLTQGTELTVSGVWKTGMDGEFKVATLNPGTGNQFYKITSMSITLITDCGVNAQSASASAFRYAPGSTTKTIIGDGTLTTGSTTYTFTAPITTALTVDNSNGIGFDVSMRFAGQCEGMFEIAEFSIEGEAVLTDEPTVSPTTKTPTMAPTKQCKGEVTWGDPHFTLMAFASNVGQLNYQGQGWYYYIFPCDIKRDYNNWPFFLLSKHNTCYWRGNRKSCIGGNRIVINTKPDPWVIAFTDNGFEIVQVGTDVAGQTAADFDTSRKYRKKNPLVIDYDDGAVSTGTCGTNSNKACQQSGELRIYYSSGEIVFEFYDVQYVDYPRTCNRGEAFGADCGPYYCEGKVIEIRNSGSWTVFTCPFCLRNIACGLMGRYTRGDCTSSQLADPGNKCYNILQGSNGQLYQPPNNDNKFGQFADTWEVDAVKTVLDNEGLSELNGLRNDKGSHNWAINALKKRSGKIAPLREGRIAPDLQVVDANWYDGLCKNDMAKIRAVNETCRQNTVVKYKRCCEEIGICPILWKACIEDLCSCAAPGANNTWTEAMCLDKIIHESMNTTCSWEALWPTATPTATPTKSPTGLVAGLPRGKKAMDLIWLYLIFVIIFVLIAGGAYWYYRKKNKIKVEFPQDDEEAERMETGNANTEVYS